MELQKAIEDFDYNRANTLSLQAKIQWISQLDYKIFSEFLKDRSGGEFSGYTVETPLDSQLLAPEEYGEIYVLYLIMKNDFKNGEIGRYNNSAVAFNRLYSEMGNFINRNTSVKKKTKIKAGDLYV